MVAGGGEQDVIPYELIPEGLKADLFCKSHDVSTQHRVDNAYTYNFCIVPNSSYDVVLFGGLAVVLACLLQGKLASLMVLVAGAVLMAIAFPVNLGALGNSLAIWLGISPWQLFFYVFLPPLLLDAAVRIDWFMFRKSFIQVFTLAFVVVGATCAIMVPIMLYMLQLQQFGWNWIHACMFGAMIASTDAVAIVSIMKTSGGPKRLRVMLEGESLLNDASGLTLFEVFFHLLQVQMEHPEDSEPIGTIVGHVFLAVFQLGIIGFLMGMVFGMLTRLFLRFMRYMGAGHDQEVALTLGMAYLAYWITAMPCKGSGVVAVAVMGLYGAATNWWDMSTHAHETFDGFWETLAFVVNSLVFLYSGASVVNFFVRASTELVQGADGAKDLIFTLWMMPIIYIILTLLRFGFTMAFRPLFIAIKGDMSFRECIFLCAAGLRGSASLIMGSAVVTYQMHGTSKTFNVVKSMMVFWTAGFVLLTLLINAPLLPLVLHLTGLSKVPEKQLARRRRAAAALGAHTAEVLDQLRDAEDELLAGVDWAQVAAFVDHSSKYDEFTGQRASKRGKLRMLLLHAWACCCCCFSSHGGHVSQLNKQQQGQHGGRWGQLLLHRRHSRHSTDDDDEGGVGPGSRTSKSLLSGDAPGEQLELVISAAASQAGGVHANGVDPATALQRRRRGVRRIRSGRRPKQQQQQQHDGPVPHVDDGSVGSSGGNRSDSSSSDSESGDGPQSQVMPAFEGFGGVEDRDAMECPFMMLSAHRSAAPAAGGTAAARPAAAAAGPASAPPAGPNNSSNSGAAGGSNAAARLAGPSKLLRKYWPSPLHRASGPADAAAAAAAAPEEVQLQPLPPQQQLDTAAPGDERAVPPAGSEARASAASPQPNMPSRPNLDSSSSSNARLTSAFAAAAASRAGGAGDAAAAATGPGQAGSSRPGSRLGGGSGGQAGVAEARGGSPTAVQAKAAGSPLRSLATRSAAPAFVYSSFGDAERAGAGVGAAEPGAAAAAAKHRRKGSFGGGGAFGFSGAGDDSGAVGYGSSSTSGRAAGAAYGMASELDRKAVFPGAAAAAAASAGRPSGAGHSPMDKALGRPSGAYRGLATRSVNMSYGSTGFDRPQAGQPGISPAASGFGFEGSQLPPQLPEGQEAAVGPGCEAGYDVAAAAVDMVALAQHSGAAGGPVGPSAARSLASRSVGMAGAYSSLSRSGGEPQAGSRFGAGASSSGSSSLATRSVASHIPPVGPVNSSLYKVSTGLGGYKPGVSAAVATAVALSATDGAAGSSSSSSRRQQQGASRSLACSSMPAQKLQQGLTGRLLPTAADFAAAGSRRDDVSNINNTAAEDVFAPDSMLDVVSKALGRISRMSVALGTGVAVGAVAAAPAPGSPGRAEGSDADDAASSMRKLVKGSHGLEKTSSYGPGSVQSGGVSEEELADARSWLLSGLKRYFHGKRMEGLLSARGLRILDAGCEVGLEDPSKPLRLWGNLSRDATRSMLLRVLTMCLFVCRRASVRMYAQGSLGRWLAYPPRVAAQMLQRPLNQVLLSSVEVAMEYLMGLTTSPYVEWLQDNDVWAVLIWEIQAETSAVAQFLIDREIEAPERYSAVQSYRVAMAVLRQQRLFVESLFESGMLDTAEQSQLAHPIEAAERRLELLGPVWKAPSLGEVLRQLPFMRGQSQQVVDFFIKYGHLAMLSKGSRLSQDRQLYIVQSGIVKVSYTPDLGAHQEYFLGAGGVFNLYTALTAEELPGATDAVAQGNALGKGPVLFCLSAKGLRHLSALATAGDPAYQQLELDMHRLAGLFLLERLQPQMELETSQALARLAPLHVRAGARPGQARLEHSSRQQRAAWVRQRLAALRQHLKQQLVKSELLVLPAGCAVAQQSHVLLLQGSIQVKVADDAALADAAAAEVARWMVSAGRHSHQSMLPWLWEVLDNEDLEHAPAGLPQEPLPVTITAGPEGAMLLVCPSADEEEAMAAGTAAASLAAAHNTSAGTRTLPAAAAAASTSSTPTGAASAQQQQRTGIGRQRDGAAAGAAAGNLLRRISSGSARQGAGAGAAAAAAGVSRAGGAGAAAGRAAGRHPQGGGNPFLRRTLATAAAADAVMEPLPGRGHGAAPAAAAAEAGAVPSSVSMPPAAASRLPSLSRHSPTTRDLARISPVPIRRVSPLPLAGAAIDNQVLVSASSSSGAVAGVDGGVGGMDGTTSHQGDSSNEQQAAPEPDGELQQQQAAAAAAPVRPEPRRTRSIRPLKAGGGKDAANLR